MIAMMLISIVPLLVPILPPLGDLPGHLARYKIAFEGTANATLSQWYSFSWLPIGNLGEDLIVRFLAPVIGLVPATKFAVLIIPPLTVAGMLTLSRSLHGQISPVAGFALPLTYGHAFLFGFTNYALSLALALLALALWVRLGAWKGRAVLFVPISFVLFFTHVVGWGIFGIACLAIEWARRTSDGQSSARALSGAIAAVLWLAGPLFVLLVWRTGGDAGLGQHPYQLSLKLFGLAQLLVDRWMWFDLIALLILLRVVSLPLFAANGMSVDRGSIAAAAILFGLFLIVPYQLFGSAYADIRLLGASTIFALLAIRPAAFDSRRNGRIALVAVAFFAVRLTGHAASFAVEDRDWRSKTATVSAIEKGASVAVLVDQPCVQWKVNRSNHLGSFALIDRDAFVNDQWMVEGSRLLTIRNPKAGAMLKDPSQIVRTGPCPDQGWAYDQALRAIPDGAFDYLWLVDVPMSVPNPAGWVPVSGGGNSRLLRRGDAATE